MSTVKVLLSSSLVGDGVVVAVLDVAVVVTNIVVETVVVVGGLVVLVVDADMLSTVGCKVFT